MAPEARSSAQGSAIRYSTIADNRAGGDGGGLALSGTGSSAFDWSTVSGNRAALSGGGAYVTAPGGGPVATDRGLFAANSTIANNRAGSDGGGIAAPGGHSTTDIESVTLARNGVASGRLGGGLYLGDGDTVSVQDTILALNLAGSNTSDCFAVSGGSLSSLGHNLVGNAGGCVGFGAAGDLFGGRLGLGKLADNGGAKHWTYGRPLQTIALLRGSRAIDNAFQVSFDERGVDRDDRPDIGAYERVTRRYMFVNGVARSAAPEPTGSARGSSPAYPTNCPWKPYGMWCGASARASSVRSAASRTSMNELPGPGVEDHREQHARVLGVRVRRATNTGSPGLQPSSLHSMVVARPRCRP